MIIAVISPTYKEEDNIEPLVESILAQQTKLPSDSELHIIISDSHSPDKTAEVTRELSRKYPNLHYLDCMKRGIGVGIVEGFRYAIRELKADILIQIDADLSHPPEVIPEMIQKINQGYDLVCGSRYAPGGSNGYGLYRSFQSYCANQFCRFVLGIYPLREFMTSFRTMKRQTFEQVNLDNIPWQARSFVFQASFVYELIKSGARFIEVPIRFQNRRAGRSKMQTFLYIKDLVTYAVKTRLRDSQQFRRFLAVGALGFTINAVGLFIFVEILHLYKPLASAISVEIAIISNFILNNFWTFSHSKVAKNNAFLKFIQFNLSSVGAIFIQTATMWIGEHLITPFFPPRTFIAEYIYWLYFVLGVGIGLFYNYFMYSRVIWKKKPVLA